MALFRSVTKSESDSATIRTRVVLRVLAALVAVGIGCGEPTAPPVPVASVVLSPSSVELVPNATQIVQAIPKDSAGNVLTNREATWSSSDPSKATVAAGVVTGVSIGTTTITATIEGHAGSVDVTVKDGAVVSASGLTFSAQNSAVTIAVPSGALAQTRNITVAAAQNPPASDRLMPGTAFEFGPAGLTFAQPVTLTIKYDPSQLTGGSPESGLQLYEAVGSSWRVVAGSSANTTDHAVTGSVSHFSVYGVLMQPRVETVTINADMTVPVQTTIQFNAVLKDNEQQTLTRPVSWSSSAPSIVQIDANTGSAKSLLPGAATITATSEGKSATSKVTVVPGPPTTVAISAGNGQTALPGGAVAIRPAALVTDAFGNGVPGFAVTFAVASGGGTITGEAATTDARGIATVGSWTLGPTPGANTLTATAGTLQGSPITFNATGVAAPPVAMSIFAGNQQTVTSGTQVPIRPAVLVTDATGRGVPGVTVVFSIRSGSGSSITGANAVSDASGVATLGSWTLGVGGNSLFATVGGLSGSPLIFVGIGTVAVQVVTFGDSNTDFGFSGTDPTARFSSYVSNAPSNGTRVRLGPDDANSTLQVAGKIESRWRAQRSQSIRVANHGIAGTTTGAARDFIFGSPNALTVVNGLTRFQGEVLGMGYPWSGGEPTNDSYPNGPVARTQAFQPRSSDFAYISLGTNDVGNAVPASTILANLETMVDQWIALGLPASHVIITTLPPRPAGTSSAIPALNDQIRSRFGAKGARVLSIDAFVSNDKGLTWKSSSFHVGDSLHYSEAVRDWIADNVVAIMIQQTP